MPARRDRQNPALPTPRKITLRQKEAEALELRKSGATYKRIAEHLGYSDESSACKAVKRALFRTIQEPADELRKLELGRLDQMLLALWGSAISGKGSERWLAIDRCLKILERKAVMLGLDAPQRRIVDVITKDAFSEAIENLESEIGELEQAVSQNSPLDVQEQADVAAQQVRDAASTRN